MSVVITGNPGVGKHTVSQKIAEKLRLPTIDINTVVRDAGLLEKNEDINDVDTLKLEKILGQKISGKNVLVGHLAPYVLDKTQVSSVIVLRRNPYDLISVYKERKYTDDKIKENVGSEILGIIAYDAKNKFQEKTFQINTSGKTIQEVVEKVMTVISNNEGNEEVDWLDLVTKNNDLKKFFVD
ncbi:MAG: adenylate kinase family protein [Nitrosopumilus sp.]